MKHFLFIILVTIALLIVGCGSKESPELDAFAKCLGENGAKMYGTFWCPHCKDQKDALGNSENIPYIECSLPSGNGQTQICKNAGIEGYPTWEFADGSRKSGNQALAYLASKTGCDLPN